jgi:hypothetical protein
MADAFHIQVEEKLFGEDCGSSVLLQRCLTHEYVNVHKVIDTLTHLNMHQKADLLQVLTANQKMFDGTLGVYPHKKFHIDIDKNAKPIHARPYPVPRVHLQTFKKELDHLVAIRVLAPQGKSE